MSVSVALQQITDSDLGPKVKANAATLLQLAHSDNGYICASWEELGDLFDVRPDTVRRHLGDMHKARIIHYSTNGDGLVYVIFKAWTPAAPPDTRKNRVEDAKNSRETREKFADPAMDAEDDTRKNRVEDAKNSRETREKFADPFTRARARSVRSFVRLPDPKQTGNERTNEHAPEPAEQARSRALLGDPDVGLDGAIAAQFAAQHEFDYLLKQCCEWQRQMKAGIVHSRGALVKRILCDFDAAIIEADRASPLYKRHVPQEETQANDEEERRRKYDPAYWAQE